MTTVKVIKVMGTSEESWEDAAAEAVATASETIDDITGIEVESKTADVEDAEIVEFKTTVHVAFPVHGE
ncbi:dodecin family protein [Natronobeatus ordinarius]|uniref:dodecin family protein n=1 Tax=Natronobeatus ordinarius TaxID=2963433 RepID=UPI0020CEAEC9|nr:dodecin family protein [Natronobeatus ordinarius]